MKKVIPIIKQKGQTPLEAIHAFKATHSAYMQETISYAGRLDPMAEGLLLLLVGDENKKRHAYESLKKTYEFSVLFGIGTDSFDLLGIPELKKSPDEIQTTSLETYMQTHTKAFMQEFPPYSSKTLDGIPLYRLSREGKLNGVSLPTKKVTVYSFLLQGERRILSNELLTHVKNTVSLVTGDFRQSEILAAWDSLLSDRSLSFPIYDFTLTCSSGTYVRAIAQDMGIALGTKSLAFSIRRTAIGDFSIQ